MLDSSKIQSLREDHYMVKTNLPGSGQLTINASVTEELTGDFNQIGDTF